LQAAETARSAGRPMSKISGLGSDFIRHPPPAEPMVRRLAAGGKWIRTIGSALG
jgi:hypothetical protein